MRICFVGGGHRTLAGLPDGGSERQIAMLASELASRGHEVTLVCPGLFESRDFGGILAVPAWGPRSVWPRGLRFWLERLPSLEAAILEARPDAVYTRGFSIFAPKAASAARRAGAAYVAALASDADLSTSGGGGGLVRGAGYGAGARRSFIRGALRRADRVLVQHSGQAEACSRLGLPCRTVRNAFLPARPSGSAYDCEVAWVGHVSVFKGVDDLVGLLPALGGRRVCIAGGVQDGESGRLLERAAGIPGVSWLGEIGHPEVLSLLRSARVLLNTSPAEGFPNAFLEAWHLERPVVSLRVDPDGLLSGDGVFGLCAGGDPAAAAAAVGRLCAGEPSDRSAARLYVERMHGAGAVATALEDVLRELSGGRSRPSRRGAGRSSPA
jgi:glycosyltransferase involved in cell wall biosynthesis